MARQTRMSFPESTTTTIKIFKLLILIYGDHTIYSLMMVIITSLTTVDGRNRGTSTQLLRCKSNLLQTVQAFLFPSENQFQTKLKTIRYDNGLEFNNNEATCFFQEKRNYTPKVMSLYSPTKWSG